MASFITQMRIKVDQLSRDSSNRFHGSDVPQLYCNKKAQREYNPHRENGNSLIFIQKFNSIQFKSDLF